MGDDFIDTVEFPDLFMVSRKGEVFSKRTQRILKQVKTKSGYLTIPSKIGGRNGYYVCLKVHRLVANAFIPNWFNRPYVNHIDGCKTNNNDWNLEWVSALENTIHAMNNNLLIPPPLTMSGDEMLYCRENYIPNDKEFGCRALSRLLDYDRATIMKAISSDEYYIRALDNEYDEIHRDLIYYD